MIKRERSSGCAQGDISCGVLQDFCTESSKRGSFSFRFDFGILTEFWSLDVVTTRYRFGKQASAEIPRLMKNLIGLVAAHEKSSHPL
jgi:hypothetical protein